MIVVKGQRKGWITLKCEDCGIIRTVGRNTAILAKAEHPCRACSNKRNGVLKLGRPSWNAGKRFEPKKLGSEYINRFGYVMVYMGRYAEKTSICSNIEWLQSKCLVDLSMKVNSFII